MEHVWTFSGQEHSTAYRSWGGESQQIKPPQNTEMKQYLHSLEKNRTEGSSVEAVNSLELRRSLTIRLINTA